MGFLSSIGNIAGGIVGSIPGLSSIAATIQSESNKAYQKEITNSERRWQEKMIQEEREHNLAQWHRENEYNDPSSQMARLREAGLNPDMLYGNGNVQNIAAHSPFQTNIPSTNVPNVAARVSPIEFAEADLLRAQKENVKEDTKSKQIDNTFKPDWYNMQFSLGDSQVQLNLDSSDLTKSKKAEVEKNVERICSDISLLNEKAREVGSRINNLDAQTQGQLIDNAWKEIQNSASVEQMKSVSRLNNEQAKNIAQYYLSQIGVLGKQMVKLDAESEKVVSEIGQIIATTNGIKLDVTSKEQSRDLNVVLNFLGVLSNFVGLIK